MVKFYWRYLKEKKSILFMNIFFVSLQIVIQTVFLMKEMKNIIENGVGRQDLAYIYQSGLKMMLFTLLVGLCTVAASYFSARVVAYVTCRVREDCYKKVLSLTPQEMSVFGESTLQMRTITDATQIQILLINMMRTSLMVPIIIVCMLILIFRMNKIIFLILLGVFAVTVFVLVYLGVKSKPLFELLQKKTDRFNLLMREKITGVRPIRAFVNEELEVGRTKAANDEIYDTAIKANDKINFLSPLSLILMNWAVVLIYLASSSQLRAQMAKISDLLLVFQYLGYFITSLGVVPVLVNLIPKVSVGCARIDELLNIRSLAETDTKEKIKDFHTDAGEIVFENVIFGYAGAVDVIANVSFTAAAGKTTAFIGTTGSGKTTIMNLIMGFYQPTFGDIKVDGVSLRELDLSDYRKNLSYATQKASVFQDTAKNNITMYDSSMSEERIDQACKAACFDEVLEKMPEGIDTVMAQGGTNISGGQRQRMSLARTVAKDAGIYIFDDTFSALDAATEKKSRESITKMLEGRTVLMVAQKIATIMDADQIIVLDKGRVAGVGRHEELLESCQEYRDIYMTQCYMKEKE
ncbi:MAG: ABC transporter ATP-binding protein/permease [Lachnospiraceae bacterium]|nr:ABC transporter ATP-binding protein/permease [Lachnospiraceae bacterium]